MREGYVITLSMADFFDLVEIGLRANIGNIRDHNQLLAPSESVIAVEVGAGDFQITVGRPEAAE